MFTILIIVTVFIIIQIQMGHHSCTQGCVIQRGIQNRVGLPWWSSKTVFPPPPVVARVQSLSLEDPLEKEMANLSCVLAWEIPWVEELGGLQSMGLEKTK